MSTQHSESSAGVSLEEFKREGYFVLRGLLSPAEVAEYRRKAQALSGLTDPDFDARSAAEGGFARADAVTQAADFWPLIFNERLVSTLRELLGPIGYSQHSDVHVHHGTVGWHRDSVDRAYGHGPDWDESDEEYRVVRVAMYLQSFEESGFSLGLIPGTHKRESFRLRTERRIWGRVLGMLPKRLGIVPSFAWSKSVWIRMEPGDCVVFDQRVLHSGSRIHGPKYAVFLSYGAHNHHTQNHLRYYRNTRTELDYGEMPAELVAQLKDRDLLI